MPAVDQAVQEQSVSSEATQATWIIGTTATGDQSDLFMEGAGRPSQAFLDLLRTEIDAGQLGDGQILLTRDAGFITVFFNGETIRFAMGNEVQVALSQITGAVDVIGDDTALVVNSYLDALGLGFLDQFAAVTAITPLGGGSEGLTTGSTSPTSPVSTAPVPSPTQDTTSTAPGEGGFSAPNEINYPGSYTIAEMGHDTRGLPPGTIQTTDEALTLELPVLQVAYAIVTVSLESIEEGEQTVFTISIVDEAGNPLEVPADASVEVFLVWGGPANTDADVSDFPLPTSVIISGGSSITVIVSADDDFFKEGPEALNVTITSVTDADGIFGSVAPGLVVNGYQADAAESETIISDEGTPGNEDSITLKVVATDVDGNILGDGSTNSGVEEETLYYKVIAVDENGDEVNGLDGQSVNVTFTHVDTTNEDYTPSSTTVAIGDVFSALLEDDYLTEGEEDYEVALGDNTANQAGYEAVYEKVTQSASVVTSTIDDNDTLPTIADAYATVSEEGLFAGIQDGAGTSDITDLRLVEGTLAITGNGSAPLTVKLLMPDDDIVIGETTLSWSYEAGNEAVLIGNDGTQNVIRIELNDGSNYLDMSGEPAPESIKYEVELLAPVDHPDVSIEDVFSFTVQASISDGANPADVATLGISIEDDSPGTLTFDYAYTIDGSGVTTVADMVFTAGADTGSLVFSGFTDGDNALDEYGAKLSLDGQDLKIYGVGTDTLVAKTDDGVEAYRIDIKENGTYELTAINGVISNGSYIQGANFSGGITGGNDTEFGLIDKLLNTQNEVSDLDILITGSDTVNNSTGKIGIGDGQSIGVGESIRFEFAEDLVFDDVTDTFLYTTPRLVNGVKQELYQPGSGAGSTVVFVLAVSAAGVAYDISASDIVLYDSNGVIQYQNGVGAAGWSVVEEGDNVRITMADGEGAFEINAESGFDTLEITAQNGTNEFKIEGFSLTEYVTGDPIQLAYEVTGTDADGDSITGTLGSTIYPNVGTVLVEDASGAQIRTAVTDTAEAFIWTSESAGVDDASTDTIENFLVGEDWIDIRHLMNANPGATVTLETGTSSQLKVNLDADANIEQTIILDGVTASDLYGSGYDGSQTDSDVLDKMLEDHSLIA